MTTAHWWVHIPGNSSAMTVELARPGDEWDIREYMRKWLKVKRLPAGTSVWPNNRDYAYLRGSPMD